MNNRKLMTILSVIVIAGLAFVYAKQGMFEKDESQTTDYGVEESEAIDTVQGYGVSASHPLAVKAGMDVIENGGNAADAAVVVSYVLGVVEPYGSGIGGGGEMLVLQKDSDQPAVYEYREIAPHSGERPDMFAIPGLVKGMEVLNRDLGSMEMKDLIEPAVQYAKEGFEVDKHLVDRLGKGSYRMDVENMTNFFPDGQLIEVNETLKQPDLADTLRLIQENGADAFYAGPIAEEILEHEEKLVAEDLLSYEMHITDAAQGIFAGYDVYAAPPPLAGITLIQSLQMAESINVESTKDNQSDYIHLIGEISKRSYDDRIQHVGDPRFTETKSNAELTSNDHTDKMVDTISLDKLSEDFEVNDSISDEEDYDNTTHFTIIDQEGTIVSATHTLGNFFGSGDIVGGFFLNNQMENFSKNEQTLNSIEPGKTPRSFTSPTILTNGNKTIGIGSPGGKRIPMVMTEVLIRHLLFDESLENAVEAKRFYIEGNDIFTEVELDKEVQSSLRARGYEIIPITDLDYYGGIQVLVIDEETDEIYGVADSRRSGVWQVAKSKQKLQEEEAK